MFFFIFKSIPEYWSGDFCYTDLYYAGCPAAIVFDLLYKGKNVYLTCQQPGKLQNNVKCIATIETIVYTQRKPHWDQIPAWHYYITDLLDFYMTYKNIIFFSSKTLWLMAFGWC